MICGKPANFIAILFLSFSLLFLERLTGFSNVYLVIVIALSCLALVLLIAVSLLAWRLRRAVRNNKREKTPQRHNTDEAKQHHSTRDQHVPEELPYMELKPGLLEELPRATQTYQSLKGSVSSSAYYNVGFNRKTKDRKTKFTTK